jgi:eukaryotic-like serine/threonine-protein kinase
MKLAGQTGGGIPGVTRERREKPADETRGHHTPLPADVLSDAARRVGIVALLYACVFFVVGPVMALLSASERQAFFASGLRWGPATISIGAALLLAAASRSSGVTSRQVLTLGLGFEVIGSYGIAAARYLDPNPQAASMPSVSWVAVWILLFATAIPSPPRRALAAALASATAVPVVTAIAIARGDASAPGSPLTYALRILVPYAVVAVLAYVAARVVYRLGAELTHARELGSYRLVERLGQGGMGEVWRAEHQLLVRPAAIKLIRGTDERRTPEEWRELRARFEREAQVTSTLRSPHTIQLYDFGVTEDGAFYYVMELLDGFDLQALVERFGPVPVDRAIHFLTQICDSLAEAHHFGLVHRDIKPANVYVCRYGRAVDFIKVLDFGLAKPVDPDRGTTEVSLTGTHAARGTPAFMSPEQALGARSLDARADLYALGCLAYWLVTGKPVFQGQTPLETIVKHVQTPPEPPSRQTDLPIPAGFDDLVLACLAKNRDDRPADASDVACRLRRLADGGAWTDPRARAWWNEHAPAPV